MNRLIVMVGLLSCLCGGCGFINQSMLDGKTAASAASLSFLLVETSFVSSLAFYKAEQQELVDRGLKEGWDKEKIRAEVYKVRTKWQPLWTLFEQTASVQKSMHSALTAYDTAIQSGSKPNVSQLLVLAGQLEALRSQIADTLATLRGSP